MPERASSVSVTPDANNPASASKPPREAAPAAQPPSFSAATPPRENVQPGNPVAPVIPIGPGPFSNEYQIKAAFLPHFADAVKWPADASAAAKEVFTVGILGTDPFGNTVDKMFQDRPVHGLKVVIRRSRDAADLRGAHMVFISKSEEAKIQEILRSFAGTSTLTVGETAGFTALGGMIEFTFVGDTIRFHINSPAARKAGLEIGARLLKLAP